MSDDMISREAALKALTEKHSRSIGAIGAIAALPAVTAVEPVAWQSTTPCYTPFITDARYQRLGEEFRKWYVPYRCQNCAALTTQPAPDALVMEDALLHGIGVVQNGKRIDPQDFFAQPDAQANHICEDGRTVGEWVDETVAAMFSAEAEATAHMPPRVPAPDAQAVWEALQDLAAFLDAKHQSYVAAKGRNPADYVSGYSIARDKANAILALIGKDGA